jgi:hypothetical protein
VPSVGDPGGSGMWVWVPGRKAQAWPLRTLREGGACCTVAEAHVQRSGAAHGQAVALSCTFRRSRTQQSYAAVGTRPRSRGVLARARSDSWQRTMDGDLARDFAASKMQKKQLLWKYG